MDVLADSEGASDAVGESDFDDGAKKTERVAGPF